MGNVSESSQAVEGLHPWPRSRGWGVGLVWASNVTWVHPGDEQTLRGVAGGTADAKQCTVLLADHHSLASRSQSC